jgi:CO/xanthine dehydrogenase Mo-binding subunit
VIEAEYRTPVQEHAYLQPEAGVAYVEADGRVTVQVAGQWMHKDRRQIAHALGLPEEQVRVVYPAIGGAFGGREDVSIQIVLALAAWRLHQRGLNRPVKLIWTREESILGHAKRHPYLLRARWGATREGRVIAAQCEFYQDAGAYAYTSSKILPTTALMITGPYDIAHVQIDGYSAFTNHIPNGAFRGFGAPQGAFVAEMQMNRLAQALKIDPVHLRRLNLLPEGGLLSVNTPIPDAGQPLDRVLVDCATAGWQQKTAMAPPGRSTRRLRAGPRSACTARLRLQEHRLWGTWRAASRRVELRRAGDEMPVRGRG